jgi:hypothetical protein
MKITKTASGKSIIKFSQSEWQDFGKRAGWLDEDGHLVEAQESLRKEEDIEVVAQPVTAPPKPGTKPTTTPTKKPGKRKRRHGKPVIQPKPKGKEKEHFDVAAEVSPENLPTITSELKKKLASKSSVSSLVLMKLAANYDRTVDRGNLAFWQNIPPDHPFAQVAFFQAYGDELARANFAHVTEAAENRGDHVMTSVMGGLQKIQSLFAQIQRYEQGNEEELMELAKDIVAEEWNVDREMLETRHMDDVGPSGEEEEHEGEQAPMTPELQAEINKRLMMNTYTQGAGLHALLSMHHLGADRLNEISPQLMPLYDELSNVITQSYFHVGPQMLEAMADMLADKGMGWAHTEYDEEGEEGGDDPKVVAQGMNFSIICQELVKGIMGYATDRGLSNEYRAERGLGPLTEEEGRTILSNADRLKDEGQIIQVAPELWRRFLNVRPEGADTIDLMGYLSTAPEEEVVDVSGQISDDEDAARNTFLQYNTQIEAEDFGHYIEEEPEDLPDVGDDQMDAPDDAEDLNRELADLDLGFGDQNTNEIPPLPFEDDDDDQPFFIPGI